MPPNKQLHPDQLTKRERQIMDGLLAVGRGTAAEVRARLGNTPSYSAVRAVLRVLEEKGLISHEYDGPRYVYTPTISKQQSRKSILKKILDTFFEGSHEQLVATLLDTKETQASQLELDRLAELIKQARERDSGKQG